MEETKKFNNSNGVVTILATSLIVSSFLIGSLWTKVKILENDRIAVAEKVQQATIVPSQPSNTDNTVPAAGGEPIAQKATKKPDITTDDYIRGNKNAKVTLVEYSDLECPFCKRFHPTMQQVMKEYGDKVRWVYRHYPLAFHQNAQKEAEAVECAGKLGGNEGFWNYVDAILERTTANGTGFALDKLSPLAKELGINEVSFQECLDSNEFAKKVKDQMAKGSEEGVSGTPGTIIIGVNAETQLVPGAIPFEKIKPMIDNALSQ